MKFSHVSITARDMDNSVKFYQEALGLDLVSRREIRENNAEIAFLSDRVSDVRIELTFWRDKTEWISGDELDHLAFTVQNMDEAMETFRRQGVEIAKEPYSLKGSTAKIAFIKDPNGIWIEIIESKKV
ncbi:MAG: VOC family protein [Candidatus Bathyarchaeota archaeon]